MNKTILHISNIKTYTKTTKDIIPDDLKHTELLNQLAISLGYRNYLTLKGMADKNDGFIKVSLKENNINPIVKKRFDNIDKAMILALDVIHCTNKSGLNNDSSFFLQIASNSNRNNGDLSFFLAMADLIIKISSKSLKAFSFIDYSSFDSSKIFKEYISINYIMYFFFLSIKFNIEDIKDDIKVFYNYGHLPKNISIIEQEFNKRKHLMFSFDLFLSELNLLKDNISNLEQHHHYFTQLDLSRQNNIDVTNIFGGTTKEDKTKLNLAQKRLYEKIELINKWIHIKLDNEQELKELFLLLNKSINTLDKKLKFPCLFEYNNGEIKTTSYEAEIHSKSYMRMYKDYKELRLALFQDKNNLNYNASINDFNLLKNKALSNGDVEYIEYIEQTLKNIKITSLLIGIRSYSDISKNKKEYELFKKMLIYIIKTKDLSTLEGADIRGLFYLSNRIDDIELLKELASNKYCNQKYNLEYALGVAYGFNRTDFITYLINEFDIKFSENIYAKALSVAIATRNIKKVKELCSSRKINIKKFKENISFVSDEIIEELLNHNFNINKNSKQTVEILINTNQLGRLKFLKEKGLNLNFDETIKKGFLEIANKKEYFETYNWLKSNLLH